MDPLTRVVRLTFKAEYVHVFLAFFDAHQSEIRDQPGCLSLKLMKDVRDATVFYTISEWENEQALEDYRCSVFFRTVWPQVKEWFCEQPQAYSLEPFDERDFGT